MQKKHTIILQFLFLLFFLFGINAFLFHHASHLSSPPKNERKLLITGILNEKSSRITITSNQLGGNYEHSITYLGLSDVNIEIDGTDYSLEVAIRDGAITAEELIAYARVDARKGVCVESYTTRHSLTHFTYQYPELNFHVVYDIYKTPDGKEHLIEEICISQVDISAPESIYLNNETGQPIDRENWGLSFEILQASSASITLECVQSGGQHIGELCIDSFGIYRIDNGFEYIKPIAPHATDLDTDPSITISQESISQITLKWADLFGHLQPGSYTLFFYVTDVFDKSQIHPLTDDFYSRQDYWVEFMLPQT